MKKFGELTREEKGELLLAHHEGKQIQVYAVARGWLNISKPIWVTFDCYRVRPERVNGSCEAILPNGGTVTLFGTFELDDYGKPVVSSWAPNSGHEKE